MFFARVSRIQLSCQHAKDEQKGLARALMMVALFPLVPLGGVYLISEPVALSAWRWTRDGFASRFQ